MSDQAHASLTDLLPDSHRDENDAEGMYDFLRTLQNESVMPEDESSSHDISGRNVAPIFNFPNSSSSPHTDLNHAQPSNSGQHPHTPSIPIAPALAALASQSDPIKLDLTDPTLAMPYSVNDDRGEMGGRRKKPLSERAGWKEMGERVTKRVKGPRIKKNANNAASAPSSGNAGLDQNTAQTIDAFVALDPNLPGDSDSPAAQAPRFDTAQSSAQSAGGRKRNIDQSQDDAQNLGTGNEMEDIESGMLADVLMQNEVDLGDVAGLHAENGSQLERGGEQAGGQSGGANGAQGGGADDAMKAEQNESRAQQNRRAQQVYRRRREERMKELETQAANLEPTRRALFETYDKLRDLAVNFEASKIQIAALQNTLLSLASQGTSVLTSDGNLPINPGGLNKGETMRTPAVSREGVQTVLDNLAIQSLELAKSRVVE